MTVTDVCMPETKRETIKYEMKDPLECNLSYMPFVTDGGLFVPTKGSYALGDVVNVELVIPAKSEPLLIEGKVVWLTPQNALHHVLPGIGIQFIGKDASMVKSTIEAQLDTTTEVGGYTYGVKESVSADQSYSGYDTSTKKKK